MNSDLRSLWLCSALFFTLLCPCHSSFPYTNQKSRLVLKQTQMSACTCSSWPLYLCIDSYQLVNQFAFLITIFGYYTWSLFVNTFSSILIFIGPFASLQNLSVLLFNTDRFMHEEKHLKIITNPGEGWMKERGRTFSFCMRVQQLSSALFSFLNVWQRRSLLEHSEKWQVRLFLSMSMSYMNRLPQQNQEEDAVLQCGLPVMTW